MLDEHKKKIKIRRYRYKFKIENIFECDLLKNCKVCGSMNNLVIHHIDLNSKNNCYSNFVTLCRFCHSSLHRLIRFKRHFKGFENLVID